MKNRAASLSVTAAPELLRPPLRLIEPDADSIAALLVAKHGGAASPLAEQTAIAAFEQGKLHQFAAWCLVTIALSKSNLSGTLDV